MDEESIDGAVDLVLRVPADESYRTCADCGGDCEPDTSLSDNGTGVRIAFVCPEHGVQSILDPFEHLR